MSVTRIEDGVSVTRSDADDAAIYGPPSAPQPPSPPDVSGDMILGGIADADRAKLGPMQLFDVARIAWRQNVPATNNKLGRIAKALGTTPDALRAAGAAGS